METKQWNLLDKSEWSRGQWQAEPDKMQFTDETTGLPCLIVRNTTGALCGYVGVSEGHPLYAKHYDEAGVRVHGGLTFADFCSGNPEEHSICHVPGDGEPDKVWWLGFDCAHLGDFIPRLDHRGDHGEYRNIEYVKSECRFLAGQLNGTAE